MGEKTELVEATIRSWITTGKFEDGAQLPSERTLATTLDAGRTTIRLVLAKLTTEGLVEPQHGRGYFVTARRP